MPSSPDTVRPQLLIVGASTRAAAASAVRASWQPATCDLFADRDLAACGSAHRVSIYPAGLLPWLAQQVSQAAAAGVAAPPWLYTGALENHPELIDAMAALAPLWGCDGAAVRRAQDPALWCQAFVQEGLPALPWLPGTRPSPGPGWLFKPASSGGGVSIRPAVQLAASPKPGFWQKLQPGQPCSAVYAAAESQTLLLGLTRQWIGQAWCAARGFHYCGSIGPWRAPLQQPASLGQLQAIGECLGGPLRLRGLVGVDLVATSEEAGGPLTFWPVEINPRYTASIEVLETVLGIPAIALHAAACTGNRLPEALPLDGGLAAKAILFARRDITISETLSDRMADAAWFWPQPGQAQSTEKPSRCTVPLGREIEDSLRAGVADIPQGNTSIARGRPICTVLAWLPQTDELAECRLATALRSEVARWEAAIYGG